MRIDIDANWFLDCDERSVNLTETKVITGDNVRGARPKAENIGQSREIIHGFYATVAQACQGYLTASTSSMQGAMTATALIAAWNECTSRIEASCRGVKSRESSSVSVRSETFPATTLIHGTGGEVIQVAPRLGKEPLYNLPQVDE